MNKIYFLKIHVFSHKFLNQHTSSWVNVFNSVILSKYMIGQITIPINNPIELSGNSNAGITIIIEEIKILSRNL